MSVKMHPLAPHSLPGFMTAPGESDWLMWTMVVFLLAAVIGVGLLYFQLHALPERRLHKANVVQLEFVAVLALLALFTHNHTFWIAALLLAFIRIPDFETPLYTIADSVSQMAGLAPRTPASVADERLETLPGQGSASPSVPADDVRN